LAEPLEEFLSQGKQERTTFAETFERLSDIMNTQS
jgi:flagellar biosynthesis/type III secretory pathway ATPase